MARNETLELLSSLIDGLVPLGQMSPGRPIRAADWNGLVEAVRTLARVAVARERTTDEFLDQRYARGDHEHAGQATLSWFDPATRALLDENVSGAVEQRAALKQVRDEVGKIRGAVDDLGRQVGELRLALDGLRDSDSAREREVGRVAVRVESLRDVEGKVSTLDERLGSISTSLSSALAFRSELVDENGNPINVRAFSGRISDLEALRRNLTTAAGNVVQIREIESALARLEQNAAGLKDIDEAVGARLRDSAFLERAGLVGAVGESLEKGLAQRFAAVDEGARELRGAQAGLSTAVNAHETRLLEQNGRLAQSEATIETLRATPGRVDQMQAQVAGFEGRLQANQAAIADLPSMRAAVAQLRSGVDALSPLTNTVGQLQGRVSAVEANTSTINQLVTAASTLDRRLGAVEAELPSLRQLKGTVGQHATALAKADARLTANEAQLDNLANLPRVADALGVQVSELSQFRDVAGRRLDELGTRVTNLGGIADRVVSVERAAAETRASVARMSNDVVALTGRVAGLETRSVAPPTRIER